MSSGENDLTVKLGLENTIKQDATAVNKELAAVVANFKKVTSKEAVAAFGLETMKEVAKEVDLAQKNAIAQEQAYLAQMKQVDREYAERAKLIQQQAREQQRALDQFVSKQVAAQNAQAAADQKQAASISAARAEAQAQVRSAEQLAQLTQVASQGVDKQLASYKRVTEELKAENKLLDQQAKQAKRIADEALRGQKQGKFGVTAKDRRDLLDARDLANDLRRVGSTLAGVFKPATEEAADTQRQLALIKGLVDSGLFKDLEKQVRALPPELGEISELFSQTYQVLQAGVGQQNVFAFVEEGAKAAAPEAAKLNEVINGSAKTWVLYGDQVSSVHELFNKLQKTVDEGTQKFSDLDANISTFIGTAHQAGISLDEVLAIYSQLTKTMTASKAAVSTGEIIRQLAQPTDRAAAAAEEFGIKIGAAEVKARGVVAILKDMKAAGLDASEAFGKIFSERQGRRGAGSLFGPDQLNQIEAQEQALSSSLDRQQAKWGEWGDTIDAAHKRAEGITSRFYEDLGRRAESALETQRRLLQGIQETWMLLPDPVKNFTASVVASGAAVATLTAGVLAAYAAYVRLKPFVTAGGASAIAGAGTLGALGTAGGLLALGPAFFDLGKSIGEVIREELGLFDATKTVNKEMDAVGRTMEETEGHYRALQFRIREASAAGKEYVLTADDEAVMTKRASDQALIAAHNAEKLAKAKREAAAATREHSAAEFEAFQAQKGWDDLIKKSPQGLAAYDDALKVLKGDILEIQKAQAKKGEGLAAGVTSVQSAAFDFYLQYGKLLGLTKEQVAALAVETVRSVEKQDAAWDKFLDDLSRKTEDGDAELKGLAQGFRELTAAGNFEEARKLVEAYGDTHGIKDFTELVKILKKELKEQDDAAEKGVRERAAAIEDLLKVTRPAGDAAREAAVELQHLLQTGNKAAIGKLLDRLAVQLGTDIPGAEQAAKAALNDLTQEAEKNQKAIEDGHKSLIGTLQQADEATQQLLADQGAALTQAFQSGDMAEVDRIAAELAKKFGVDIPEGYKLAQQAVQAYNEAQKEAARQAKEEADKQARSLKELEDAYKKLAQAQRESDPQFQQSKSELGQKLSGARPNGVTAADQAAIEKFAKTWGIDVKDAIDVASDAVKEYQQALERSEHAEDKAAGAAEKHANKIQERYQHAIEEIMADWNQLIATLTDNSSMKKALGSLGKDITELAHAGNFEGVQRKVGEFAATYGLSWNEAIKQATQAAEQFERDQEQRIEAIKQAWAGYYEGIRTASASYKSAIQDLGAELYAYQGNVQATQQIVENFAKANGVDLVDAINAAGQAVQEINSAWDEFEQHQKESSDAFQGSLDSLGKQMAQYRGNTAQTRRVVEEFARVHGISIPDAIKQAEKALDSEDAKAKEAAQKQADYLKDVEDAWGEYADARMKMDKNFDGAVEALGKSLLSAGNSVQAAQGIVQNFANTWGLELPEAIRIATKAYEQAATEAKKLADEQKGSIDEIKKAWEDFYDDQKRGSKEYQDSLASLGKSLLHAGEDQGKITALVENFARVWQISIPDAIHEAGRALDQARDGTEQVADDMSDALKRAEDAWHELAHALSTGTSAYEEDFKRLGQLVADHKDNIREIEPFINAFALKWGIDVPEALDLAMQAYQDMTEEARRAAEEQLQQTQAIEDAWTDLFRNFEQESSPYKQSLDELGRKMQEHAGDVNAIKGDVEAFAQTWGLDIVDAIHEAQKAFQEMITKPEWLEFIDPFEEARKKLESAMSAVVGIAGVAHNAHWASGFGPKNGQFTNLPGFATGADFFVGGRGKGDKQVVAFKAESGERVSVTPAARAKAEAGRTAVFNFSGANFYGNPTRGLADQWAAFLGDAYSRADRRGQVAFLNQRN